jgi:hypothetical protein
MAARVAAVAAASKTLFTTDWGKNLLLASSKLPTGSLKMATLVKQLERKLPVAAAREATEPEKGQ